MNDTRPRRVTVTVTESGKEDRLFHLSPDKADRFVNAIREKGGTATIGPLALSDDIVGLLRGAGVDPKKLA